MNRNYTNRIDQYLLINLFRLFILLIGSNVKDILVRGEIGRNIQTHLKEKDISNIILASKVGCLKKSEALFSLSDQL